MRFQRLIKLGGLLSVTVPTVPPRWFEWLYSRGRTLGYASKLHLYFFTPRLVELTIQRAGYDIIQTVTPRVWLNPWLRPMHKLLSPISLAVTVIARPRPGFQYGETRESYFLPEWAADLAPFHQDYHPGK